MLWTEYRPAIKIGPKGALGSHEIRPIHSGPSLGQSILVFDRLSELRAVFSDGDRQPVKVQLLEDLGDVDIALGPHCESQAVTGFG